MGLQLTSMRTGEVPLLVGIWVDNTLIYATSMKIPGHTRHHTGYLMNRETEVLCLMSLDHIPLCRLEDLSDIVLIDIQMRPDLCVNLHCQLLQRLP